MWMELKLGDRVNIWGYTAKLVEWDKEYFYFKHDWSPAVFQIKRVDMHKLVSQKENEK